MKRFKDKNIASPFFYTLCVCTLLLLKVSVLTAQQRLHRSFQISSDNDSYTLTSKDGYYTNGIRFTYRWNSSKDTSNPTIHALELGQLMYNSENGSYREKNELDRPITAFLYASYQQTQFNHREDVFRWGIALGTIGPPALGRPLQESIHHLLGMYKPKEWDYQLKTEFGANATALWSPSLSPALNNPDSHWNIKPVVSAALGNTFTNAALGTAVLWGRFNQNNATVFWDAQMNSRQSESFLYFYPQLIVNAYNATVQGGLFRKDKGPYTGKLNHVQYMQTLGWMYSRQAFSMGIALLYESKESLTQIYSQWYGRLTFGLSF